MATGIALEGAHLVTSIRRGAVQMFERLSRLVDITVGTLAARGQAGRKRGRYLCAVVWQAPPKLLSYPWLWWSFQTDGVTS